MIAQRNGSCVSSISELIAVLTLRIENPDTVTELVSLSKPVIYTNTHIENTSYGFNCEVETGLVTTCCRSACVLKSGSFLVITLTSNSVPDFTSSYLPSVN